MSFLRFARPGVPGYTSVDLGPSHARAPGVGGTLVVAESEAARARRLERALTKQREVAHVPAPIVLSERCGRPMRLGAVCGRRRYHGQECRSRARLDRDAERRRRSA